MDLLSPFLAGKENAAMRSRHLPTFPKCPHLETETSRWEQPMQDGLGRPEEQQSA